MAIKEETTTTVKPNLLLVMALVGGLLIAHGQGWINVGPQPDPTPLVVPTPGPVPTPVPPGPNPTPNPVPSPTPTPEPEPPIVNENFPALPAAYATISTPINSSLFTKATAEDALIYARFFRDSATALRLDPTITSNSHFVKVYPQALTSLMAAHPGLAQRNKGLGAAIDAVLATQGLDLAQWTEQNRRSMAEAMDAVSYRCLESYRNLMGYPPMQEEFEETSILKDKVA